MRVRTALSATELLDRLRDTEASVVIPAPAPGPGNWVGGPSAVVDGDTIWLAYRLRRPEGSGRGLANILARSDDGGLSFETVTTIPSSDFGAASLERPALVRRPDGGWRIYVSCSTPNSKHWWVEALDADTIADLPSGDRTVALPGDEVEAWKDVIVQPGETWEMWACRHPLDGGDDQADRMSTWYATSPDGLDWTMHGPAIDARPGEWDARGARVCAVVDGPEGTLALYDGRASADENFFERTAVAVGTPTSLTYAAGPAPAAYGRALRYACLVETSAGIRAYYETGTDDGSHHLVTALIEPRDA